jgi:predicted nucleic acid-binding protein
VHKIMLAEAAAAFSLDRAGLVNWLQRHRNRITELHQFREAADELLAVGMSVVPADGALLQEGARLSVEVGLLTNDALILALIQRHGLVHLATNDDDFDAAPGLTVWKPR